MIKQIQCVITLLFLILSFNSCSSSDTISLRWFPEESYFVGYEIIGDTVKFQYSICFENCTEYDTIISLQAKFRRNDLKGWMKYENFFAGYDENGETLHQLIEANQKINIVYTFIGKYTGGTVNEKISFPERLILQME